MICSHIFEGGHAVWGEDDTNTLKRHIHLLLPNQTLGCQVGLCLQASLYHQTHYQYSEAATNSRPVNVVLQLLFKGCNLNCN